MKALYRFLVSIVATGVTGYGLVVAAIYVGQDSFIYRPYHDRPDRVAAGAEDMQEITLITADGVKLGAWYRQPVEDDTRTVVFFHGNCCNIGFYAPSVRFLAEAGYGLLLFDYRGYGGNDGEPSEEGLYADGRAALDFLASRGVPSERVVAYGESLGTGVAVEMAAERSLAAVVLVAPYTSIADIGSGVSRFLPVRFLVGDRFSSIDKIPHIDAPLLILHGEMDKLIPVHLGRALLAAAGEPKQGVFMPEGTHADLLQLGGDRVILDFLARHLARGLLWRLAQVRDREAAAGGEVPQNQPAAAGR